MAYGGDGGCTDVTPQPLYDPRPLLTHVRRLLETQGVQQTDGSDGAVTDVRNRETYRQW